MPINKKSVLLLKASEDQDKYDPLLTQHGFLVNHIKTLTFINKNLDIIKEKLSKPNNYSGLIFTSSRGVYAVQEALSDSKLDLLWTENCNYVVGESTYQTALNDLGLHCDGKQAGNAYNLANIILKDASKFTKPFLFPCGNLKLDILKETLKQKIHLEEVIVYETIPDPNLEPTFCNITSNFTQIPEYLVYFSPSGVKNTINIIKKFEKDFINVKFVALGLSTAEAIKNQNLELYAVAKAPTPNGVLEAILA